MYSTPALDKEPPYPAAWPEACSRHPKSVVSRISERQKEDLYNRRITTRQLAQELNVREEYISSLFPGKIATERKGKTLLLQARKEIRKQEALRVLDEQLTITQAATNLRISYRSMARAVQAARAAVV